MKKSKKFLAFLTALSISVSAFAGLTTTAFAEGETTNDQQTTDSVTTEPVASYDAEDVVKPYPGAKMELSDRTIKLTDGTEKACKALGYVAGGINNATPKSTDAGVATLKATVETAGEYDVVVTFLGTTARRTDIQVGENVYDFGISDAESYSSGWTLITTEDSAKPAFTHTFSDVALAAGENTILVGTNDGSYAPDFVGLDIYVPVPEVTPDGISFKKGTVTVKADGIDAATLIYAEYNSAYGNLKKIETYPITFTDGIATQEIPNAVNGAKLMVWDSVNSTDNKGMKPLSPAVNVTGGVASTPDPTVTPTEDPNKTPGPIVEPTPTVEPTSTPTPISYIYERGIKTAWSESDLDEWTLTGNEASTPVINASYGLYCDTNQTGYVTKEISLSDNAVVTYNAKFYTNNSTGREVNYAYLKFGSAVAIGYNSTYNMFYSIDGGATYNTEVLKNGKGATTDIKVVINTSANTLVSLFIDGKEIASAANTSLSSDSTYDNISMGFVRAGSVNWNTLYGLVSIGVTEVIDDTVYHKVTYSVDGKTTTEAVADGEKVAEVPATDKLGYIFKGWKVNDADTLISTAELQALVITTETTAEAVYEYDNTYTRSIKSVDFVSPITTAINYPAEAGAVESKTYTVKVTADTGDDITADCTFAWDIVGNEGDDGYCKMNETVTASANNLEIKQGGQSTFGYIKATATYTVNATDKPMAAQVPFAVITDSKPANQILPAAGYPISMDDLSDNLVGYVGTESNYTKYDIVLNNWCIVGSNPARDYLLVKDETANKKAIKITNVGGNRDGSSSSTLGVAAFPAQTEQYVFETIAKFEGEGGRIGVWNKTPNNVGAVAEWSVTYTANTITAGDGKIEGLSPDAWYKVVVASDPANDLYSVYVYDMVGTLKGSIESIAGGTESPKYLCVDGGFPVYINSLKAYTPSVDSVQITSDTDVVRVPENDTDVAKVSLSANCKTADGIKLTGAVEWSLAQEYQGVTLEKGVQTATLKVQKGAAGTVQVNATMGGKTATKTISLTNSSNVVSFKQSKSSITIPFANEANATAVFKADTITPDSPEGINDTSITYSFLDKTGAAELATLPNGITSNVENGTLTLTVAPGATPAVFYVKATNSEGLSTKTQVNVHGLSYQFGTKVEEGYTQVTAANLYNETLGYGFESTSGLTDAETSVSGTAAYKFKANVPNGNYKITVNTTSAAMFSEIVDSAVAAGANVTGISKSGSSFDVAVCDNVLDLTFDADSSISTLSIAQAEAKTEREKPAVFAIGDSTTKSGKVNDAYSWGECTEDGLVDVPEVFSTFSNNGMAGRDSVNFYNQGRVETVLLNVHPGDYVTVNMGINSRNESGNEAAAYPILMDNYYVKAIMDRGAIPVIVTATPLGYNSDPTKGFTVSSDGTIDCDRGTGARNGELRKIAQKYNLNIIELGYYFEDYFNNKIAIDGKTVSELAAEADTTALELIKSWYPDHNHYKQPLGIKIGTYILDCVAQIAGGSDAFNQANDPHITEQ